jgi:hypothetical protein
VSQISAQKPGCPRDGESVVTAAALHALLQATVPSTNSCTKGWGVARCEFGLLRPCSWHAPTAPGVIAPGNIRVHIGPHWAAPSQGLLPLAAV